MIPLLRPTCCVVTPDSQPLHILCPTSVHFKLMVSYCLNVCILASGRLCVSIVGILGDNRLAYNLLYRLLLLSRWTTRISLSVFLSTLHAAIDSLVCYAAKQSLSWYVMNSKTILPGCSFKHTEGNSECIINTRGVTGTTFHALSAIFILRLILRCYCYCQHYLQYWAAGILLLLILLVLPHVTCVILLQQASI